MHLAITQDEVGQDGEHRTTRGALETPDDDPTQANTDIMGVAGEAPATATGGLVFELKAKGQEKIRARIRQTPCRRQAAERRSLRSENRR
jgi:hypothetical protein